MIDIDYFKPYNDTYGHTKGDECLKRIAEILSHKINRGGDKVARYGGEEFAVILSNTETEGAKQVAERLCEGVREAKIPHEESPIADHVTISAGVAGLVPDPDVKPEDLIHRADNALYKAKENGRDGVH